MEEINESKTSHGADVTTKVLDYSNTTDATTDLIQYSHVDPALTAKIHLVNEVGFPRLMKEVLPPILMT
jgi:hypothetical protein